MRRRRSPQPPARGRTSLSSPGPGARAGGRRACWYLIRRCWPGRVTHARAVIAGRAGIAPAEVAERVAASIVFLGLAARLVSPSLGAVVLGGVVPDLTLDNLWWRPVDGGPVPLAAGPVTGREIGDAASGRQLDDAAALLSERCVQDMTDPVAGAFQALFRLSPLVLRGNIASALAGAAGMLARTFPDRAETAGQLTARILALPPLRGTGELVQPDPLCQTRMRHGSDVNI